MKITNILPLFPQTTGKGSFQELIPGVSVFVPQGKNSGIDVLVNLAIFRAKSQLALAQFLNKAVPLSESDLDYQKYFQFPNKQIQRLADSIVEPHWSDDQKAFAIEQYVIKGTRYVSDLENHGVMEYWSLPTETIKRKTGDCEDGAWLMGSLMLHAGVDPSKIFFYGGTVRVEENSLELGGHGWIGYKRSDGEVIPLDWCYYPTSDPLSERVPLKDNMKYYDDMFIVGLRKTIETPYTNYVRNPPAYLAKRYEVGHLINSYN